MAQLLERFMDLFQSGGLVMYPLLFVSVVSLTLVLERGWFWMTNHRRSRVRMLRQVTELLRRGERSAVALLVRDDGSPYGAVARQLLKSGASDAVAVEVVEMQRPAFDRFMTTLSTIITAAPMLGILGTVTGIIQSFNLLGEQRTLTDPRVVSGGIAEALITTAFGLVIAIMTLFPYMIFRGQVDHAMGRLESIIAAAQQGERVGAPTHAQVREVEGEEFTDPAASRREAAETARPPSAGKAGPRAAPVGSARPG